MSSPAPKGSSLAERINNAIVDIDWATPSTSGMKPALDDLVGHWLRFWDSADRRALPPLALHARLVKYAEWYARAWALSKPAVRERAPDPRALDASITAAVEDQIKQVAEGAQATAAAGSDVADYVAEQAKGLREELGTLHTKLLTTFVIVGVIAIGGLLAFAKAKPF